MNTDQLLHRLHELTEELAESLGRLDDIIGPRYVPVGHIDDTPTGQVTVAAHVADPTRYRTPIQPPLHHHRLARDLHGTETVERTPGCWAQLVEVRQTDDPFAWGMDLVFDDGQVVTVHENSSVRVRHTDPDPATVRAENEQTRRGLRPQIDQHGNVRMPQDAA
jgi:hypothetical protein